VTDKLTPQVRIILATVLSFLFFALYDHFFIPKNPPVTETISLEQNATPSTTTSAPEVKSTSSADVAGVPMGSGKESEIIATIKAVGYEIQIDRLGRIAKFYLEEGKYKDDKGERFQLIDASQALLPLEIRFSDKNVNADAFVMSYSADKAHVDVTENGSSVEAMVQFTRLYDKDLPTRCDHSSGGFRNLHERVIEVIDGALGQLPDNQPTLVVVASTEWVGLDENSMMAAMFSLPKVTYRLYTEPPTDEQRKDTDSSIHFELQGVVQKAIRKRLSAVGVWHHKWTPELSGLLDIYHNPLGARQIPYKVLELPKVCQLVPKSEGIMEWVPSRPPR